MWTVDPKKRYRWGVITSQRYICNLTRAGHPRYSRPQLKKAWGAKGDNEELHGELQWEPPKLHLPGSQGPVHLLHCPGSEIGKEQGSSSYELPLLLKTAWDCRHWSQTNAHIGLRLQYARLLERQAVWASRWHRDTLTPHRDTVLEPFPWDMISDDIVLKFESALQNPEHIFIFKQL